MSFGRLLRHSVTIRHRQAVEDGAGDPTYDELGMPITTVVNRGTWRCRIQPLTAEEVALLSQAGAVVSTHRVYGYPTVLEPGDQLVQGALVYEVQGIPADAGGSGHHYEVLAQLVTSEDPDRP